MVVGGLVGAGVVVVGLRFKSRGKSLEFTRSLKTLALVVLITICTSVSFLNLTILLTLVVGAKPPLPANVMLLLC